ncbi:BaiN/RdsA family NAD(P)/FAD-dependent oxidoreductase [Alkaliphilus crotonatoxidans]
MGNNNVIIVGGGAAGLMAALSAAESGNKVILMEKNNQLGKKLSITGGGRCNLTNINGSEMLFQKTVSNSRFLYSALSIFNSVHLMNLFKQQGVALKVEEGGRVFPESNQAQEIISVFHRQLKAMNVEIRYHSPVSRLIVEGGQIKGVQLAEGNSLKADAVILATGGMSYPATGSSGDGFKMAQGLGHTLIPPRAALVPIELKEPWIRDLMGISLKEVRLFVNLQKKKTIEMVGPLIFTHFGLSGPAVLQLSSYINRALDEKPITIHIDFLPELTRNELEDFLIESGKNKGNKQLKSHLAELLPRGFADKLLEILSLNGEQPLNQLSKANRETLLNGLKDSPFKVKGLRDIKEAIVTAGGIHVKEINPKTMESKLIKGLYFAGEMIDVDALTGGYNLQIAFSTGYLAGRLL